MHSLMLMGIAHDSRRASEEAAARHAILAARREQRESAPRPHRRLRAWHLVPQH